MSFVDEIRKSYMEKEKPTYEPLGKMAERILNDIKLELSNSARCGFVKEEVKFFCTKKYVQARLDIQEDYRIFRDGEAVYNDNKNNDTMPAYVYTANRATAHELLSNLRLICKKEGIEVSISGDFNKYFMFKVYL